MSLETSMLLFFSIENAFNFYIMWQFLVINTDNKDNKHNKVSKYNPCEKYSKYLKKIFLFFFFKHGCK